MRLGNSTLNKYRIFEGMPTEKEAEEVVGYLPVSEGMMEITKRMLWIKKINEQFSSMKYDDKKQEAGIFKKLQENIVLMGDITKSDTHIFRIDEDLIKLLQKTDTETKYQPLAYPQIYIDGEIEINNKIILQGLFITEYGQRGIDYLDADTQKPIETEIINKLSNKLIIRGMIKIKNKEGEDIYMPHFNFIYKTKEETEKTGLPEELKKYFPKDYEQKIRNFVCCFLDFLNTPDIEIITHTYNEEDKEKAKKKGKIIKSTNNVVRITGKLKLYLDTIRTHFKGQIDWTHSWWVRGHFKHFRSNRFKNKQGTKTWVYPYIKGKGALITKDYVIKKTERK